MKKLLSLLALMLIFFTACEDTETETPSTSEEGYYSVENFQPLVGLTKEQVTEHYNTNYANSTTYDQAVTGFSISGRQKGSMTETGLKDFKRRTNFFLSFHQLPPVGDPENTKNQKAQEAALSMAVQDTISHTPLDDGFTYATETAQEAASSSNLAISWSSAPSFAYTQLLDNLVMDNGVASTGHRRWFLLPGQKGAGYGYLYNTNSPSYGYSDVLIQWVFDYDSSTEYDLPVLYPAAGAFPIEFTIDSFNRLVDFTLYWKGASFNNCTVTMKDENGSSIPVTITAKEQYSQYSMPPAALIWKPSQSPTKTSEWTVKIEGISGKSESTLEYTIKFMELGITRDRITRKVEIR